MQELIKIENGIALLDAETSARIAEFERMAKSIKEQEDALKQAILAEMEEKGILKLETEEMTVSYVAPTDRETFDSKTFKKENPKLYDEYVKMTPVKSGVRIKVK